jgi:hypothetical protein
MVNSELYLEPHRSFTVVCIAHRLQGMHTMHVMQKLHCVPVMLVMPNMTNVT